LKEKAQHFGEQGSTDVEFGRVLGAPASARLEVWVDIRPFMAELAVGLALKASL
jgi:hypothetical protein